jgi:hypothetical protein
VLGKVLCDIYFEDLDAGLSELAERPCSRQHYFAYHVAGIVVITNVLSALLANDPL